MLKLVTGIFLLFSLKLTVIIFPVCGKLKLFTAILIYKLKKIILKENLSLKLIFSFAGGTLPGLKGELRFS